MADIEVQIVKVKMSKHPNADRLSIALIGQEVGGYECVVGLNQFADGDEVIYIPPGSVVPVNIQEHLSKNKISIKDGRIRAIKIRNILSEGLCLNPSDWLKHDDIFPGNDVTDILGVTKYEPPARGGNLFAAPKHINNHYTNMNFKKYDCVSHFKKYPNVLDADEAVAVTIKFHGSNARGGWVDRTPRKKSWWEALKGLVFKESPKEFLVGSHNTIRYLTKSAIKSKSYETDLYWRAALKYDIKGVAKQIAEGNISVDGTLPDVVLYYEVIGPKVQSGYEYGVAAGEIDIRVFDIMINKQFLGWESVVHLCDCFNLPTTEALFVGPWNMKLLELAQAVDEYDGQKFNREGVVIRPLIERRAKCGRVMLKYLNPDYLLDKKNTEHH